MWTEGPIVRAGWPERFAWASFSGGLVGLLLVGLIVWVERLDLDGPVVPTATSPGPVAVRVERARSELRIPERAVPVSVPLEAVLRSSSLDPYCFVAEPGRGRSIVRVRSLVLGPVVGRRVIVRGGLEAGEPVVVRGQERVVEGTSVLVESAELDGAIVASLHAGP